MKSSPPYRLILVLAVGALIAVGLSAAADGPDLTGKEPPAIQADGWLNTDKPPTLADLKGKVAVVEFWATWCPPCRRSIPHIQSIHEKRAKDGLVVIGLSNEPKATVEPFVAKMKMTYIVGFGSKSGSDYGVEGIPAAFVIGPDGKVVWSGHPMDDDFEKAIDRALAAKR